MTIKVRTFGIATDIVKARSITVNIDPGSTIGDLKLLLHKQFPEFDKLRSVSFAIGEEYVQDDAILDEENEVIIIPPVSGG